MAASARNAICVRLPTERRADWRSPVRQPHRGRSRLPLSRRARAHTEVPRNAAGRPGDGRHAGRAFHVRATPSATLRALRLRLAAPRCRLVQAFTKLRKGRSSPSHAALLSWNDKVVEALRRIGPFWDTRRSHHAVFAQRCAGPPYERNGLRARSLAVQTWPSLWDENVTLLCFEPATYTNMGRGIYIPYVVVRLPARNKLAAPHPKRA